MLLIASISLPIAGGILTPSPSWWAQVAILIVLILAAVLSICLAGVLVRKAADVPSLKQARLRQAGRCEHCGYDLRASPTCCPECGWIAKQH